MGISVVLADDHPIVRHGLRGLLAEAGFRVVGEAGDGVETLHLVERLQPDVLVLDLLMPGLHGLEVTRQVPLRCRKTRVAVLSIVASEAYVLEALRNGASGYILKKAVTAELVEGVRKVAAGERYLSPPFSEESIAEYARRAGTPLPDPYDTLTNREREVLQLVAEGQTSPEIAARLFIGVRTVETHRSQILKKLGLRTPSELVRYAIRRGLLFLDD